MSPQLEALLGFTPQEWLSSDHLWRDLLHPDDLPRALAAAQAGAPYAVAFVDVRMPPGWDGIVQAVERSDQVLVLKKPFDNIEVLQMAHALSKKWQLTQIAQRQMADRDALVSARTAELREVLVSAEHLALGSTPCRLLILQDVTDRTRLETELRQAQKMEAVGRLRLPRFFPLSEAGVAETRTEIARPLAADAAGPADDHPRRRG